MNQGARDENERMYRQNVLAILERIASKLEEAAHSAPHNSAMDAILALYKRWEATTPKVQHVWGVQEFIRWAQEQHQ